MVFFMASVGLFFWEHKKPVTSVQHLTSRAASDHILDEELGLDVQQTPEAHDKGYSVWCTDAGKNV